jgi:endonuclease III
MASQDNQSADWRDTPADKIDDVVRVLDDTYGPRPWYRHSDPVDQLVGTILSQNTSDTNTARSFASLKEDFPSWEEVRTAPTSEVVASIRAGGLANQKGPRIQRALTSILDHRGSYDLGMLEEMPVPEAMAWLTAIVGVGPKTAACVLLFSLGMPALPVDTHVYRVSRRLGLIDANVSEVRAHDRLLELLGEDTATIYSFHVEMIAHGRTVCVARRPKCPVCPLRYLCRYAHQARADA